jgi:hypothetical protein
MHFNFDPVLQDRDWVQPKRFPAVPGMVDLVNAVGDAGCTVVGLTGRRDFQKDATARQPRRRGLPLLPRRPNYFTKWNERHDARRRRSTAPPVRQPGSCSTIEYKSDPRATLESQGLHMIANFGDQFSDLIGGTQRPCGQAAEPDVLPALTGRDRVLPEEEVDGHDDGGGTVAVVARRRSTSTKPRRRRSAARSALSSRTSSSSRSAPAARAASSTASSSRWPGRVRGAPGRRRSAAARRRRPRLATACPTPRSSSSHQVRAPSAPKPATPRPPPARATRRRRRGRPARAGDRVARRRRSRRGHETRLGPGSHRRRGGAGRAARGRAAPPRSSATTRASQPALGRPGRPPVRERLRVERGALARPPAGRSRHRPACRRSGPESRPRRVVRREVDLLAPRVGGDHEVARATAPVSTASAASTSSEQTP